MLKAAKDLECIKVIREISNKVIIFIKETLINDTTIYYNNNGRRQKYIERIINYHYGHISNFCTCINKYYNTITDENNSEIISEKLKAFYKEIEDINNKYISIKADNR